MSAAPINREAAKCHCGIEHCGGCDAEASLAELLAMQGGRAPLRCVKVTAEQLAAMHDAPHLECVHRGDYLRAERCTDCCGNVRSKVFACALHGECTPVNQSLQIRTCATCGDMRRRT